MQAITAAVGAAVAAVTAVLAGKAIRAVDYLDVVFIGPIDPATFTADDIALSGPLGKIDVGEIALVKELGGQQTYRVSFPMQQTNGRYTYTIGPNISATNGKLLDLDWDGIGGEAEDDLFEATFVLDTIGPRIARHTPAGDLAGTVESVEVWFSETIDTGSLSLHDIRIDGPNGRVIPTGLTEIGNSVFRIGFNPQTAPGQYHVLVGPDDAPMVLTVTNTDDSGPGSLREAIELANVNPAPDTIEFDVAGKLDAWIDFNDDGDWADPDEQIFSSRPLTAGANPLTFDVPALATVTDQTFARFRFSSAGGLSFDRRADDG